MADNNINIQELFESLCNKHNLTGASFVVANSNEILESYNYGLQSKEKNIKVSDKTIFRIASISKTVAAISLMMLVEKGLIDLDEDISKYLGYKISNPYYPDDIITVRMITLQTSSILDGYDDENPAYDNIIKGYNGVNGRSIDVTLEDLLTNEQSIYYTKMTFGNYHPGSRFCYSNFGCGIMACIIEKVSGMLFIEYIEKYLFEPLGIDASYKAYRIKNKEEIATMYSYHQSDVGIYPKEYFTEGGLPFYKLGDNFRGPAGGLFISMKDLAKIMRIFLNYGTVDNIKILERKTVEEMYQMHWCGMPEDTYRAKGIQMEIQKENGIIAMRGHTGSAYGVRSFMFFSIEHNIGGCFITNGINDLNEYTNARAIFKKLQESYVLKYSNENKDTIVIKNQIITKTKRNIIDKDMFLLDMKYIKLVNLMDALDIVPNFKEDDYSVSFSYNQKNYHIDNIIYYHNNLYIPLLDTLKLLDINYKMENNTIIIK